jgi:parallel beta-helix repeat protein
VGLAPETTMSITAPMIMRNVISNNRADRWGGGIEVAADDGSLIENNILSHNTAVQGGGAIDVIQAFPSIVNNTIVRNCLQGINSACVQGGGGIALTYSGAMDVANNVIAWNEAAVGGGGVDEVSSSVTYSSNDVFQNLPGNFGGIVDPTGTGGNISVDPMFEDEASRDYRLRSYSPAIDAGVDSLAPSEDHLGIPRGIDGDADSVGRSDMGAFENDGITGLKFPSSATALAWDRSIAPAAAYNLYRGDLQTLLQTGIYTQDTGTVPGARRQCDLLTASATDLDTPAPGRAFFYLAVVSNVVEGTLGFTSGGAERPFTAGNRCP